MRWRSRPRSVRVTSTAAGWWEGSSSSSPGSATCSARPGGISGSGFERRGRGERCRVDRDPSAWRADFHGRRDFRRHCHCARSLTRMVPCVAACRDAHPGSFFALAEQEAGATEELIVGVSGEPGRMGLLSIQNAGLSSAHELSLFLNRQIDVSYTTHVCVPWHHQRSIWRPGAG